METYGIFIYLFLYSQTNINFVFLNKIQVFIKYNFWSKFYFILYRFKLHHKINRKRNYEITLKFKWKIF